MEGYTLVMIRYSNYIRFGFLLLLLGGLMMYLSTTVVQQIGVLVAVVGFFSLWVGVERYLEANNNLQDAMIEVTRDLEEKTE